MSLGNTFENNTASSKQDAYESDLIELNIGNGDYVLYYVNTTEITIIPSKYSLIDENQVTSVKDQKSSGIGHLQE